MTFILGVKVDALTRRQAIHRVMDLIFSRGQHIITTPNPEIIVAAQRDHEFREILNRADLALPDGVGLIWAGRVLGTPFPARIAGSDFIWDIAELATQRGYTIYLLGAGEGVAQAAAEKLKATFSNLKIVGAESGQELEIGNWKLEIERIRNACPDILLVAFGHGKQEKWIAEHLREMPSVKIAMGIGGAFDFLAGRVSRAPNVMRRLGLEWFWRLARQPWRITRIWRAVVVFPFFVLKHKFCGIIR